MDKIGRVVRSSLDLEEIFSVAARELACALEAVRCGVFLNRKESALVSESVCRELPPGLKERFAQVDAGVLRFLESQTHPFELNARNSPVDFQGWARSIGSDESGVDIKSILVAPLVLDAETIGAILIYRPTRQSSLEERQFVQAVASDVSLATYKVELHEKARSAAEREAFTNHLLTAVRTAVGVDHILNVAVEGLGTALGVTRAVIYTRRERQSTADCAGSTLRGGAEYRTGALVPSLIDSTLDLEGCPLLGQLLQGEVISIPDTNEGHPVVRAIGVRLGVRAMVLAPIAYNGQMVAALSLEQFDRARVFSDEELALIRLVSEQTAVALYQAELYRDAEDTARKEALISKISSAIHSSLDPDTVLQAIVKELGQAFNVCRCRLALLPDPLPELIAITHEYVAPCCARKPAASHSIPVPDNLHVQAVLSSRHPLPVEDVSTDPRFTPHLDRFKRAGIKSMMGMAIWMGGRPIGVFSLHHCERRHSWTQWEIEVVQAAAEQAAVAIRQAELYREARESATRAALVNQIVASIRRSLDLEETLQVAVEELGRTLGANRTAFRKLSGNQIVVVAEYLTDPELSLRDVPAMAGDYIMNYLTETRRTLVVDDVRAFASVHPDLASTVRGWQVATASQSEIVCPIFINENFWGGLVISQTEYARRWTASEIALVEAVSAQVEVAVSHSHLFEEAKRAAQVEALVSHIIHGVNQSNQLDEIFPVVARELGEHLAADSMIIARKDPEGGRWRVSHEFSDGQVVAPGMRHCSREFTDFMNLTGGAPVACADVEREPAFSSFLEPVLRPNRVRSLLMVTLAFQGVPRLAVAAIMRSRGREWTSDEMEVLRAAATQVSIAFERAELFEQVSRGKRAWEATFDAISDGIFIFDRGGTLQRVNQAGAAFEGATVTELAGRKCCTLLQETTPENCRVASVIETGRPITFELLPERLARPVLVTISAIPDNPKDHPGDAAPATGQAWAPRDGGAVCIVRDLSELRAAEAVAREQRSFLVKLIEHANDAIFAVSPKGRFVWFNDELARLSGYSKEELHAGDYRRFLTPEDQRIAVERFQRALLGQAQTFEMHGLRKDGAKRLLLITYTPIYDEGRVTSVLSIARDVTEERLASERAAQADKLRALGQLASGVAHNFNNILAAILGHAQLVKRAVKDAGVLQRIDIIERAALDGAQTVKRIQGFGLSQETPNLESVDLNQLIQDSATLTRARWRDDARALGLHYDVELNLNPLPIVLGSASELREVFVNIILNALDAMPEGGKLQIMSETRDGLIHLHFTDYGKGMNREVRDRMFEPFFTTKGTAGMGLGLAVSYSIVERHGGQIEARSEPGLGTTISITFPSGERNSLPDEPPGAGFEEAGSILVIDDDDFVREAVVGMLRSAGHRTDFASSGPQALIKLQDNRYDIVVTDLSMPEMDGWAVAAEVKRRWPETRVVLMTGYAVPPRTVEDHRQLVETVIFKPIRFDDISAIIVRILRESRSRRKDSPFESTSVSDLTRELDEPVIH